MYMNATLNNHHSTLGNLANGVLLCAEITLTAGESKVNDFEVDLLNEY